MKRSLLLVLLCPLPIYGSQNIPTQAWSRDINAGGYADGAPIGGFGAGTISWRFNGNFYLNRLNIGTGNDSGSAFTNDANARFYLFTRPVAGAATTRRLDAATLGSGQATYHSLFPESWVDYTGNSFPVKARVTQFSPLIPGDYRRVSYPVGVYEWSLTNPTASSYEVAIMLSWNNSFSGASAALTQTGNQVGLVLTRAGGNATAENQGEFSLGSISSAAVSVTRASNATLANLEADFSADGLLSNTVGANPLGGLAFKVTLAPGETVRVPIVLAWDIPIAQVGASAANRWYRRYTRYFGRTGLNSWGIAAEALTDHASWEASLDAWQGGVLGNPNYPNWLKSMLFNELYIYFAGGTYWEAGAAGGQADDPNEDMFSHLESYIYPFYGTSDVRFYGSWALFLNWPDIDKQAVKQFSDSVHHNRTDRPAPLGTTAHDFGDNNSCFTEWNAYTYRDSTQWKDLNSKLVLMVWRDYVLSGSSDTAFLNYCWRPVTTAMARVKGQDSDGDGLPNSNGIDQTYDDMDLTGDTAYCGGLFLAACQAAKQIALARGDAAQANTYQAWFDLGQPNFESELWTGSYYRIDTGSFDPARIMSDQMCGQWYSKALGLGGIVPDARAQSALQTIHDNNFMRFDSGTHGIVNVMTAAGNIDTSTPQTQECWVGTSWGAVAGMVHQGLLTQASNVGQSLYNTIWNTSQFWFRTPEAWRTGVTQTRAYYYMRATTVWAVKRAFDSSSFVTPVPTPTRTGTPSPTRTPTSTPPAPTATSSRTSTPTPTFSRTVTSTASRTATPSLTATQTPPQPTPTSSRTATSSVTSTVTPTFSRTTTPSSTSTQTPLPLTPTSSRTATPSATSTPTSTVPAPTGTPTRTSSATSTPTILRTLTPTPTLPVPTWTSTRSRTATPSATSTATLVPTLAASSTATSSRTATVTTTLSSTSTGTPFPPTATSTGTSSRTMTPTLSSTRTMTGTAVPTSTWSPTETPSPSMTPTRTFTRTSTATLSPTESRTMTASSTPTATLTFTLSLTATNPPTSTPTLPPTPTATLSATFSPTSTPPVTATPTLAAGSLPLVFPNPVLGPIARFLPQAYGGPSDVRAQVYTPTFKLVLTKNYPSVQPGTSLSLDLVDDWGEPLAGGLYYLVVTVQGKRGTTKLVVAP